MKNKLHYIVLIVVLVVAVFPIVYNQYFVTLDGPSHLYNARLMLDFLLHRNTDFISKYYYLNSAPDTNWFSHLALAFIMLFSKPFMAEKILQILYVVSFILSAYLLINYLNKRFSYAYLALLPFVYNHTFQMGFYNYSFGVVLMMFTLWFYLSQRQAKPFIFYPVIIILLLVTYLTHIMAFLQLVATLGLYVTLETFVNQRQRGFKNCAGSLFKKARKLLLLCLPGLVLAVKYFYDRRGMPVSSSEYSFSDLVEKLYRCSCIITLTSAEKIFTTVLFVAILIWVVLVLRIKFKRRELKATDSFLINALILFLLYFKGPATVGGGGLLPERVMLLPFLFIVIWLCSVEWDSYINKAFTFSLAFLTVALIFVRMPVLTKSSAYVAEIMSCEPYVQQQGTLLALDYAPNGITTDGNMIADGIWMYFHLGDYLGVRNPLIILGNYEANLDYFPINWQNGSEPYYVLSKCEGGIQNNPPCVDIMGYKREKHKDVNYVLLIGLTQNQIINHPYTQGLLKQLIDNKYKLIYTSENKRAKLYKLI